MVNRFFGAATAYVESTLGQIYKEKVDGEYRGGPAYYIEKGLNRRWAGMIFGVAGLLAMAVLMPGVQSNAISAGFDNAFSISPWITGIFLAVLLGVIIIGELNGLPMLPNWLFHLWLLVIFLLRS